PLVLGRDAQGRAFALRDSCPHRGMPLSFGHFDGITLECCYHGWQFDAHTGRCTAIPSLSADSRLKVERIFAGHFPCEERDGYVWVYMPDPAARSGPTEPVPPAPQLPTYGQPINTTIDFALPNMRFEQIRCGPYWFSSRATVTPIRRDLCRIDFVAAWNIFRWVPFAVPIFRAFARRFLRQDQQTMEK